MSHETVLPVDSVAKRLSGLVRAGEVRQMAYERTDELNELVVIGFGQVIDRFNRLSLDSPELEIMPKTKALLEALGGVPMPSIEELTPREIVLGVNEAREAMLMGQDIKLGKLDRTPENISAAINTPSMDTGNMALAVGTAGHIIERTFFSHFKTIGVKGVDGEWTKDDILFALADCAVLMQAEFECEISNEKPLLFDLITTPNKMSEDGGLGWRKPEYIDWFMSEYVKIIEE